MSISNDLYLESKSNKYVEFNYKIVMDVIFWISVLMLFIRCDRAANLEAVVVHGITIAICAAYSYFDIKWGLDV